VLCRPAAPQLPGPAWRLSDPFFILAIIGASGFKAAATVLCRDPNWCCAMAVAPYAMGGFKTLRSTT